MGTSLGAGIALLSPYIEKNHFNSKQKVNSSCSPTKISISRIQVLSLHFILICCFYLIFEK